MNDVGEPCAGEPHARFDAAAGGNLGPVGPGRAVPGRLPPTLQLSGAAAPNRAGRATIAFLESDRPDAPRAGDAYGDLPIAPAEPERRHGGRSVSPNLDRPAAAVRAIALIIPQPRAA